MKRGLENNKKETRDDEYVRNEDDEIDYDDNVNKPRYINNERNDARRYAYAGYQQPEGERIGRYAEKDGVNGQGERIGGANGKYDSGSKYDSGTVSKYDTSRYDSAKYDSAKYDSAKYDSAKYDTGRYTGDKEKSRYNDELTNSNEGESRYSNEGEMGYVAPRRELDDKYPQGYSYTDPYYTPASADHYPPGTELYSPSSTEHSPYKSTEHSPYKSTEHSPYKGRYYASGEQESSEHQGIRSGSEHQGIRSGSEHQGIRSGSDQQGIRSGSDQQGIRNSTELMTAINNYTEDQVANYLKKVNDEELNSMIVASLSINTPDGESVRVALKKEKNRRAAKKSRDKKAREVSSLEVRVRDMGDDILYLEGVICEYNYIMEGLLNNILRINRQYYNNRPLPTMEDHMAYNNEVGELENLCFYLNRLRSLNSSRRIMQGITNANEKFAYTWSLLDKLLFEVLAILKNNFNKR